MQHFSDLFTIIQNPDQPKWSIRGHYIGGLQSALRINKDMAYGHRGLQIVWAITVISEEGEDQDGLMRNLTESLGQSHGVCKSSHWSVEKI
jgi:hypothetical protein